MQKTKLGISIGMMGAAVCFAGLFGGYVAALLLTGYVLLREENGWLRRTSVKVIAVMMFFSLLSVIVGFIPDILSIISHICGMFGELFSVLALSTLINAILAVLELIRCLILILLGLKALKQGTIVIPTVDRLIDKYM